MTYPKIGNEAPAFSLQNHLGETVKLTDLAGKVVVLYFYPKALTPGCTAQACGLRDVQTELKSRNAVAFGVSPDPIEKLKKFVDKHELNFDLLSDPGHAVADKYGVWGNKKFMGKEFMGILRTTFIIAEDGRLIGILDKFKTASHHEDVLTWLDESMGK